MGLGTEVLADCFILDCLPSQREKEECNTNSWAKQLPLKRCSATASIQRASIERVTCMGNTERSECAETGLALLTGALLLLLKLLLTC